MGFPGSQMGFPGMKITNFHYSNGPAFKDNGYQEFPKWIHMPGYPSQMVRTKAEEEVLRARPAKDGTPLRPLPVPQEIVVQPATQVLTGENDEYELLTQIAAEKDIKIDKRWNLNRLRAHIERETANL